MTLAQTNKAKVIPIAKKKRKLTAAEKAQRKEARMNVEIGIVEQLRSGKTGQTYYADYSVLTMAQRHSLSSVEFLFSILSCSRPYNTAACDQFVEVELCGIIHSLVGEDNYYMDDIGNVIVSVGKSNTTLWSCHTDTVHPKHVTYCDLVYDDKYVTSADKRQLGADDGVGIWLMLNMIEAGVDGLYVFHAGEECGGIGSSYIAKETPKLLQGVTHAIAFDRKSTSSVITHMGFGGRCCSNEFANDFANKLNIGLFPDSTGVYTDTAEYVALIPECTNISAGYYSEHTFSEYSDYTYAQKLLAALLAAHAAGDLDNLVVSRNCDDLYDVYQDDDDNWGTSGNRYYDTLAGAAFGSPMSMLDIVKTHPHGVVSVLKEFGIDAKYLSEYIGCSVH